MGSHSEAVPGGGCKGVGHADMLSCGHAIGTKEIPPAEARGGDEFSGEIERR
jgi:hypothetical protein